MTYDCMGTWSCVRKEIIPICQRQTLVYFYEKKKFKGFEYENVAYNYGNNYFTSKGE